jgi:hypothetical protein
MRKHIVSMVVSSVLLLALVACSPQPSITLPPPNIEVWVRNDIAEIARSSTDIIRAEVIDIKEERISPLLSDINAYGVGRYLHNVYELKVVEVFKGDSEIGEIVEAMQNIEIGQNHVTLSTGSDFVLFLRGFESESSRHLPMAFEGGNQGVYRVPPNHADKFDDGIEMAYLTDSSVLDIVLISACPFNDIILTIGDLLLVSGSEVIDNDIP